MTTSFRSLLAIVSVALSVVSAAAQEPVTVQEPAVAQALAAGQAAAQAPASNQGTAANSGASTDEWKVTVYPLLGWVPIFGADLNLPSGPIDGGGDGSEGPSIDTSIDRKLTGALMFGVAITHGPWRLDGDGLWAALTGDRPARPKLTLDLDIIYGHLSGGRKLVKDLYVTGGVRRVAMQYDIRLEDLPHFRRKPGLWDPLVGIGWHHEGKKMELHATLEGGGFGVGADQDISGMARIDWKPVSHFGLTGGYAGIHLKVSNTVLGKTFTGEQTLHGPILGIGLYF